MIYQEPIEKLFAQGLVAGINAARKVQGKEPVIFDRAQSYIGTLVDDLVTKGTEEPYRLLSSRAEFRLLMRHDNADLRLTDIGHELGLISESRYSHFCEKRENINKAIDILNHTYLGKRKEIEEYIISLGFNELKGGILASEILKRPGVSYNKIREFIPELHDICLENDAIEQLEVMVKYEGYIAKQIREAESMRKLEEMKIPSDFDFINMDGLRLEARQKLDKIKPLTIGQASRVSGVNPSDISILILNIREKSNG